MLHTRVAALFCRLAVIAVALAGALCAADLKPGARLSTNQNILLWEEGKVPMANGTGPLDTPFLTVFLPPEGKRNGASVVIAPGGSNIMLMYGAEGIDIAERYNDWGVSAFVLTYRLSPRYNGAARYQDGKRAVQMVRAHAAEWKLDPNRIGLIGFSAGSELTRATAATPVAGDPNAADPLDRVSSRPDYIGLVYSVGRPTQGEVLKNYPPVFLLSAAADMGPAMGSAQFFMELNRAGAVAELHIYQKGRHGFGSGYGSDNFSDWMPRLEHFLKVGGLLPTGGK